MIFRDRRDAAAQLTNLLLQLEVDVDRVVALAYGGVECGRSLSATLDVPLYLVNVAKIRFPRFTQIGLGVISEAGISRNEEVLGTLAISQTEWQLACARAAESFHEKQVALSQHGSQYVAADDRPGNTLIVDDGIASGASVVAILQSMRRERPDDILTVATPVCSAQGARAVRKVAAKLFTLDEVDDLNFMVDEHYQQFEDLDSDCLR